MKQTKKESSVAECSARAASQEEGKATTIEGSRIINLEKLQQYAESLSKHSSSCQGSIILAGERRDGLASILTGNCNVCGHSVKLEMSNKMKGPRRLFQVRY